MELSPQSTTILPAATTPDIVERVNVRSVAGPAPSNSCVSTRPPSKELSNNVILLRGHVMRSSSPQAIRRAPRRSEFSNATSKDPLISAPMRTVPLALFGANLTPFMEAPVKSVLSMTAPVRSAPDRSAHFSRRSGSCVVFQTTSPESSESVALTRNTPSLIPSKSQPRSRPARLAPRRFIFRKSIRRSSRMVSRMYVTFARTSASSALPPSTQTWTRKKVPPTPIEKMALTKRSCPSGRSRRKNSPRVWNVRRMRPGCLAGCLSFGCVGPETIGGPAGLTTRRWGVWRARVTREE